MSLFFAVTLAVPAWAGPPLQSVPSPAPPAATAPDSNMGFRCERHLPTVPGFQNVYVVSIPGFFGITDLADTAAANPCAPAGPPDGVINADDVLCDWWTSQAGSMTISRRDDASQTWQSRMASRDDATGIVTFTGGWTAPLVPREAYFVTVTAPSTGPVDNVVTLVGSHDPSDTGHVLVLPPGGEPLVSLLNPPYHTMYSHAVELVCGLANVDFLDVDGDFLPDSGYCASGLFGVFDQGRITVATFDDVADAGATDDSWVTFTVDASTSASTSTFSGTNFALSPCDGYVITIEAPYSGGTFLSPHF